MNASTHHIDLLLKFKAQLFNYQDTQNEVLIRSGLRLMEGYTLRFPDSSATYQDQNEKNYVDLHTIHRYLQTCPGLSLLGPSKYWASEDTYLITIEDFVRGNSYQQEVVMKEPFKHVIELPFPILGSWSITLKLIKFGTSNLKVWQSYLDSDYDARAVDLLNKMPKDFGLPLILREYDFLKRVSTVFNQNKQQKQNKSLSKIIRSQMPAYRQELLGHKIKLATFKQKSGQPLIYDFIDHCEFHMVAPLSRYEKFKISLRLWRDFFTI